MVMTGSDVDLERTIAERFPELLSDESGFDEFYENFLDPVRGPAITVIEQIRDELEVAAERGLAAEGIRRDRWHLFGDQDPIKSARSARSKLARDLFQEKDGPSRLSQEQVIERLFALSDLARCRIVCTFECDARELLEALVANGRFLCAYRLRQTVKDFIWDRTRRDGLKGHRARQFSVAVPCGATELGFEVQLMTELQHAWDRRNHPIYEHVREGGELPDALLVNDFSCSEALHLVDQQADRNWRCFVEERQKGTAR